MFDMISERVSQLPKSDFVRILKQAEENPSIISLGPGEPDFEAPDYIIKSACKAMEEGHTHYSPIGGREELKRSIVKKVKRDNGVDISTENVIVTTGSNEAILLALMCLVDPGEEVLVPDPSFLSYRPTVDLMNGYPVSIPLKFGNNFQITGDMIREQIKDPEKVRALILCNPSNPTGRVLSKQNMKEIVDIALEHDIILMVDEAYEKLVYTEFNSFMEFPRIRDHLLTLQTFSKSYAMPGFRIGYAIGPKELVKAMTKTHTYATLTAPTMSQLAAITALEGDQSCVDKMYESYKKRRELVVSRLKELDYLEVVPPGGAFYAFPKITNLDFNSEEFCKYLLDKAGVLMVPGTEFGRYGDGFVRISFATDYELIQKAFDRVEKAFSKL